MDAQAFWRVIGEYNSATLWLQISLLAILIISIAISYKTKFYLAAKLALGLAHLFIGIVFFGIFGTEPIQKFFALPLYICSGLLFLYDGIKNRKEKPLSPNIWQIFLLLLYAIYPLFSLLLGHKFPQIVTHIMPCPVVCLGIIVCSCYQKKNKVLLALLTIWGLTGVKSLIFNAYEDLILLLCGIYGLSLFIQEVRYNRINKLQGEVLENMRIINLGGRIVNTYLIESNGKNILIDTGYTNQYHSFKKKLKKNGLSLKTLDYVFLTHAHDDHAGFLNEVLEGSNAKVILHEKAVERLYIGQNSFDGGCSNKTALFFCNIMKLLGRGEHKFPALDKKYSDRLIVLNEESMMKMDNELGVKIIETPGHTECSISLLFDNGILFCGDAAMNGFPSNNKVTIWVENLEEFCASWKKIISLNPVIIYSGHGKPFTTDHLEKNIKKAKSRKLFSL
jgi:glyoxylase-like metal-dependent hydrolase (beta-lactamase superfamily II)